VPRPVLNERAFQQQVLGLARLCGWSWYHTHDSRRSPAGFPDLVLCKPPRLLVVELKSQAGRVRPEQAVWLDALRRCGVDARLWRPGDWAEIERTLKESAECH
jgi:hypothetical protein